MGGELSHIVACVDIFFLDGLSTFDNGHSGNQSSHLVFIEEIEFFIWGDAGELAESANIRNAIVLGCWCPGGNDLGDGGAVVVIDVST